MGAEQTGRIGGRPRPAGWAARLWALLACLLVASALTPSRADAHPWSSSALLLDVGPDRVTGQVQLPIDRLAIALDQYLDAAAVQQPAELEILRHYVAAHVSASDAIDGVQWEESVTNGRVATIDGVDHLAFDITLSPPAGTVSGFRLHDDAIVHRLLSHRIFVSSRPANTEAYTVVGLIDWESQTVTVPARTTTPDRGFLAAIRLGNQHIAEGA